MANSLGLDEFVAGQLPQGVGGISSLGLDLFVAGILYPGVTDGHTASGGPGPGETHTRTITPNTVALQSGNTRTLTPNTASLETANTRTLTGNTTQLLGFGLAGSLATLGAGS